jgi:hypothetical protein
MEDEAQRVLFGIVPVPELPQGSTPEIFKKHLLSADYSSVNVYLQDAVRQLILKREEQPLVFLKHYFRR